MGDTINIGEYLDILKRRKKVMIFILIVFMLGGGFLQYRHSKSYVPTYTSTVSIRINVNKNTSSSSKKKSSQSDNSSTSSLESSTINQNIAQQYSSLAVSKTAMLDLIDKLNLNETYESISSSITVTPQENLPEFIDISVTNYNSKLAKKIANEVPNVFNDELKRVIGLNCVETLYDASEPLQNPKPADNTFRNFTLVGIVLAIFVALLLECLDNKVVTPEDIEKYWGLPVIGVVPFQKVKNKGKRVNSEA